MCIHPITVKDSNGNEVKVKCGKCYTCRKQKVQHWAIKLIKENEYHLKSCFITLTFDNKILLDKNSKAVKKYGAHVGFVFDTGESMKYFQKFIKRLRKHYKDKYISYFHVAEYGEKTKRPHHHAIIYGINFEEDRHEMEVSKTGHTQYYSKTLEDLWACGRTSIQDTNSNNIIYTAQYSLKKWKNAEKQTKYRPKMTFSNRCKMSVKWARRNPEEIIKGYLTDKEGKKYAIPQSYKDNFKKEDTNSRYFKAYLKYEQNCMEYFDNHTNNEIIENEKIKEKIAKLREANIGKPRDF